MKILVINAGSSSLKYQLFDIQESVQDSSVMVAGLIERIGETQSRWIDNNEEHDVGKVTDHHSAMHLVIDYITAPETGVIEDINQIDVIGHRVVQGGEKYTAATVIDEAVKEEIKNNFPLAPIHNPANLMGIEVAEQLLPSIPNIAIFDTEFHQSMPPKAFLYGLPHQYYSEHKIRKYGFHGTSHKYVSQQAAKFLAKPLEALNLISIHLGNGCSVSAIEKGHCIDTSMGLTPLSGLMMGTRSGDFDPGIIGYLQKQTGMDTIEIDAVLNNNSGLKGICGLSDMRDVQRAAKEGDEQSALAIEMFCYQIKKTIGAYVAALGNADVVIFTGGIGENNGAVRAKCCENLQALGIELDDNENANKHNNRNIFSLHSENSLVKILLIPTNEELQIAMDVKQLMSIVEY